MEDPDYPELGGSCSSRTEQPEDRRSEIIPNSNKYVIVARRAVVCAEVPPI